MKKRLLILTMSSILAFSMATPVFAAESTTEETIEIQCEEESTIEEEENVETNTAYFFLHESNQVREEDGTTIAYPSSDYLPDNENHKAIEGQISETATGATLDETLASKLDNGEALTEEEETSLKETFASVEKSLGDSAPSLQNNETLKKIVLDNYDVTEEDINNGNVKALWYVVKTGAAIAYDGCGYHVDGIIYNVSTGKISNVVLNYGYIIRNDFYTQIDDEDPVLDGSEYSDKFYTKTTDTISIGTKDELTYNQNTYILNDDKIKEVIPSLEFSEIGFKYIRYIKTPEPTPDPEPEPTPTPDPEPSPIPDPEPTPTPDPVIPTPVPDTTPQQEEIVTPATTLVETIETTQTQSENKNIQTVTSPKTGDDAPIKILCGLIAFAVLGLLICGYVKLK